MMYEELVKRLKEPCQYENCVLCQEAADAIEELNKRIEFEHQSGFCGWTDCGEQKIVRNIKQTSLEI